MARKRLKDLLTPKLPESAPTPSESASRIRMGIDGLIVQLGAPDPDLKEALARAKALNDLLKSIGM